MSDFNFGVGGVVSADIAVPEHEREVGFYSRVLTTGTSPLWQRDLMNNIGVPVIGLGAQSAEYAGLPLQWMPHIQVADVAASAARAVALGGRELMHHRDADGNSQWAVLVDPDGAAFGIIPVLQGDAIPPLPASDGPMGRIAWLDLTVTDAARARDFYRDVVGWSVAEQAMSDSEGKYADYVMQDPDGDAVAGICHARGVNAGLPPVWLLYLPVDDLAESLRRVEVEGGSVIKTSRSADGTLRYAVIRDPVGAHFSLAPAS